MAWYDELGFGIPELDTADRQLCAMAYELCRAISSGRDMEDIHQLMEELRLEAIRHFEYEEHVLLQRAYPRPAGHAALHRQIRMELEHASEELRDVKAHVMWVEYGHLITQLIVEHVRQETINYRRFMHSTPPSDTQGAQ